MKKLTLTVHGMSCGGCSGRLERGLAKVDGVQSVEASHDDDRATIHYDVPDADGFRKKVVESIESMGFTPVVD